MSVHDYNDKTGKLIGWRIRYRESGREREQRVLKRDGWTKTMARARDAEIARAKAEGQPTRRGKATLDHIYHRWNSEHVDGLSTRTQRYYRDNYRLRIQPELGHLPAAAIDRARVRQLITKWRRNDVGAASQNAALDVLRQIFNYGIEELDMPLVNPAARLKKARPKHQRRRHTHVSLQQFRAIVAGAPTHRDAVMILATGLTGLRISELVAIHREDFDAQMVAVRVRRSRDIDGKALDRVKAGRAADVTLHAELEDALRVWWESPDWERKAWRKTKLAFPNERGGMIDPKNWRRRAFYPAIQNAATAAQSRVQERVVAGLEPLPTDVEIASMVAGVAGITPHDLRAFYGYLIGQVTGDVLERRDEMRHESVELTIDTYGTRAPDARRKLREAVAEVSRGSVFPAG